MTDLPRRPVEPLPAPEGAFDIVRLRARARRTRSATLVASLGLVLVAAGVVAALPAPAGPYRQRLVTGDPTPTATATPEPSELGERPGWGCGDAHHEHTGPPGNPDAERPCATHEEPADSGEEDGEG